MEELDKIFSKVKDIDKEKINTAFLESALDTVIESRRGVAFTYPIGYFLND